MTPYVIDNKKRQEYFSFLIFFTVISFGLGYFFGFHHGKSSSTEKVVIPVVSVVMPDAKESINKGAVKDKKRKPEKSADKMSKKAKTSKKDIKDKKASKKVANKAKPKVKAKPKAKPKPKPKAVKSEKPKKIIKKVVKKEVKPIVQQKTIVEKPKESTVKKAVISKQPPAENLRTVPLEKPSIGTPTPDKTTSETDQQPVTDNIDEILEPTADEGSPLTEEKSSGYSVQAGMFANKENAEKYVDRLNESGFDAFVVNFVSSSGKQKYNVRFGNFTQRNDASVKMTEYKKLFTTPAYIVFSK
jgi:cell division septation protein DedD